MTSRAERVFLLAAALVVPVVSVMLANGYPYLKDSGELTASMATGGIAHPTGFPAQHALASILAILPVGPVSFRIALVCALAGTVAFLLTALLALAFARAQQARPGVVRWNAGLLSCAAGCALVVSDVFWLHWINVEVYVPSLALSGFLILAALRAAGEPDRTGGWLGLLMLAGGVSCGMHVTCLAVFIAGVVLVLTYRIQRTKVLSPEGLGGIDPGGKTQPDPPLKRPGLATRAAALGCVLRSWLLFFLPAALVVLYLPLRAMQEPVRNWGDPSSFTRLLAHLTGASIRSSFSESMFRFDLGFLSSSAGLYASQIWSQTASLLPLAAVGLCVLALRSVRLGTYVLALLMLDAGFSILVNPMGMEEKQTSLLSLMLLCALAGAGGMWVTERIHSRLAFRRAGEALATATRRRAWSGRGKASASFPTISVRTGSPCPAPANPRVMRWAAVLLHAATLCLAVALLTASPVESLSVPARANRRSSFAYQMGLSALHQCEPDAIEATSQDDLSAVSLYLKEVEQRRLDVLHVVKQMICDGTFMGPLLASQPHIAVGEISTIFNAECDEEGRGVYQAWSRLRPVVDRLSIPLAWELGDSLLDEVYEDLLWPDYPCFVSTRRESKPGGVSVGKHLYFGWKYGQVLKSAEQFLEDDMASSVVGEYERLAGAWLLRQSSGTEEALIACRVLESAVRHAPRNCQAMNNHSACLFAIGRLGEAEKAARAALDSCPLYLTSRVNLVRYLLFQGKLEEGKAEIGIITRSFPRDEWAEPFSRLQDQLRHAGLDSSAALLRVPAGNVPPTGNR